MMRYKYRSSAQFSSVTEAVRDLYGSARTIADRRPVSGGDINDAYALVLDDGTALFMKSNSAAALPFFLADRGDPDAAGAGHRRGRNAVLPAS